MMQKTSLDNKRNINYMLFLNIKEQIIIIIITIIKIKKNYSNSSKSVR